MNATFTKTIVAALALGTSLLAVPAFAGDRHQARCDGPIVDARSEGWNDLRVAASGCSETSIQQTNGGNDTSIVVRDDARLSIEDMGGSDTDYRASGRGQIGARNFNARTSASVRDDARASIENFGGVSRVRGSGRTDTIVRNHGGTAIVENHGRGTVDISIER